MTKVISLPGVRDHTNAPVMPMVEALEDLLELAKQGRLRSFIGTGFMDDGSRLATWCDHHDDVYEMLGSIAWLQHEYVQRKT